jgi:signal transduction histidine kinase
MTGAGASHLTTATIHLIPAFVLAVVAHAWWRQLRTRRPQGQLFRIVPLITGLTALHFFCHAAIELTPTQLDGALPRLHTLFAGTIDVCVVLTVALFRHLVPLLAIREEPPSRRWLTIHYGCAAAVLLLAPLPLVAPWLMVGHMKLPTAVALVYGGVVVALALLDIRRLVRRGAWPRYFGTAFNVAALGASAALGIAALLGLSNVLLAPVFLGAAPWDGGDVPLLAHTATGLAFAAPFAVVMLGEVLESLIVAAVLTGAVWLLYFAVPALAAGLAEPELHFLAQIAGAGALVLVLVPGRRVVHAAVHRLLFRHSERSAEDLQAFLHTLSPEAGILECCRRALAEVLDVMRPRGAAILLSHGRGAIALGDFGIETIEAVWPTDGGADLPSRAFGAYAIRAASLREALVAADADLAVPIASPRQRWGHLFVSEGLLAHVTQAERHVEALEGFAAQLALVLDGAELLARALAVERSLAHAEKLAAIGELAARVAHEIRNPVTAARSLAQQLCEEPGAAFPTEHALILAELERVERQVAALLRFARRDEFRFEPVALGPLVRDTLDAFRSRLEAAGVTVAVETADGVTARADREKLRQVLVNLLENALDALADGTPAKRVACAVSSANGTAAIEVIDSGPGVPADALAHLFEPFFSLKSHGTGLGLAIAKRTVDAHGGRISAAPGPECGLRFRIELPLARGTTA